jgi:Arc/MetJ-type ribon-helix-helix transcriptional regulator
MKTYQITLPDEFAEMAERLLARGKYDSFDYMVMAALFALEDQHNWMDQIDPVWEREQVRIGLEQLDRGEVSPLDMPAIWKRAMERLAAEKEAAHAGSHPDPAG